MTGMTERRYRARPRAWATALMSVVAAGTVLLAYEWYTVARQTYLVPQDGVTVAAASTEELAVSAPLKERYRVSAAAVAYDAAGELRGYVVKSTVRGYKSDIVVETTFAADGETVATMRVLDQEETEYLGERVQTEAFSAVFAGRRAPMKLWGSATLGSPIDALSGATVSSQAVVSAVNNAYACLTELRKGM